MSPLSKARLASEILGSYVRVRRALRRDSLPAVVSELRIPAENDSAEVDGRRLARAVVRTLEPLPLDSRCLMRSLVLLRVLASRGVIGKLVIAVRPEEQDRLNAHAWVEVAGQPLLAPAGADHGRLVTL
ncbi:MAG TPA: lasso peptide biosynthesis B2 protein [Solirubrobacteraceae bacterium]|nr:lasso peptide biosynthesis B2 protein [Solirubrobacteraceae bacterium]